MRNPWNFLRWTLAAIFLSAGVYRIFFFEAGRQELLSLGLPIKLVPFIICFEIIAGILLLVNKYVKIVSLALMFFLIGALIRSIMLAGTSIWANAGELFIFNLTPTDFFMHTVFLIILLSLFFHERK